MVLGALLALRNPRWAWGHLPAAAWGAAIEFGGWTCPLTPLEDRLREWGGEIAPAEGFIARYLLPAVYPAGLTRELQIGLGAGVLVLNLALYALVLLRRRRRGGPAPRSRGDGAPSESGDGASSESGDGGGGEARAGP